MAHTAVFEQFRTYDWSHDAAFLAGLASMRTRWQSEAADLDDTIIAERTEAAKRFYFNKYVCLCAHMTPTRTPRHCSQTHTHARRQH